MNTLPVKGCSVQLETQVEWDLKKNCEGDKNAEECKLLKPGCGARTFFHA